MGIQSMFRKMKQPRIIRKTGLAFMAACMVSGLWACASQDRTPLSFLDTSEHHTYTGMVLMKQDKHDDAEREFALAIQLNKKSALGYAGFSLVTAIRGDMKSSFEYIARAEEFARRDKERLFVHIAKIRLYTMSRQQSDWVQQAEQEFEKAILIDPRSSAAFYFMGLARMMNYEFEKAGICFIKVLDLNDEYLEQADREWKRIKTILTVKPSSRRVEEVAIADRLTRAQAAVLIIDELRLEDLYRGLGILNGPSFSVAAILDIKAHRYSHEIEKLVEIGVEGLGVYPEGNFYPDDLVTRLNLAVAVHDILIKIRGGKEPLDTGYPYGPQAPDRIDLDHPHFRAVMAVTIRGIMSPSLFETSKLAPYAPISGADALMTIKKLKDVLLIGI